MIISLGLDGKINSILPENIYQGSNKINTIVIVAPFSSTSIIDIQFELPNGKITEPFILDRTSKINEEINTWSLDVTSALTQFKGVVRYNVRALSNGETIATAKGSFKIIEGVDFELPETPEQNVYDVLLNKVSNIETKTEETRSMSEQAQAKAETALENSNYAIFQIEGALENSQMALETANSISGTANTALELADDANKKANTIDEKIANLVNSAPETLDTLGELAKAITDNQEVVDALNNAIINKADKTEIPTLTSQLTNNSGFITEDDLPTDYVTQTDLDNTNQNVNKNTTHITELSNKTNENASAIIERYTKTEVNSLISGVENKIPTDYAKLSDIPEKTSDLTNDSGFITKDEIPKGALLYSLPGNNTDGAMTQKAVTDYFVQKTDVPDDIMDLSTNQDVTGTKNFDKISAKTIYEPNSALTVVNVTESEHQFGLNKNTRIMGNNVILDSTNKPKWYNLLKDETKELATTEEIPDTSNFVTYQNIYPVGSIYLTVATDETGSVSPASFLGGTWERLPEGYALWTASTGAGDTIDAGLPNIYGKAYLTGYKSSRLYINGEGALQGVENIVGERVANAGVNENYTQQQALEFNASSYNDIYGASDTVQPPAYKVYAWRRIA